ncbi:hypothetical protein DICPUDRAFT_29840 [Dictyostelium purpureum]|uniref:Uncharacterized protein n=1 Tax=Dictyostelium purpureum TaxID=5786 RepID=F0ZEB9_DICPU|nr:uncharacterized protein DICPUDRAFT_29840 [Dictyostelium purpureum]EGC37743.1 hypothetical protein DICPUDRAFT_29840 [Dictyostelium purpureum]|eukprot:XP_003285764.1 hypothetical protein DICPUDRAFT_29840 [Dictyostelium purpureum]
MADIKIVALDLGGVLFSAGKEYAKREWKENGYDVDLIHDLLISDEAQQLRKGIISDNEFWNNYFKTKVPSNYNAELIKQCYYRGYILDEDIVSWMKRIKENSKSSSHPIELVAFSGNIPSRIKYLNEKYQFRKLFDKEAYSFDCGATKPDNYFIEYLIKVSFPEETKDVTIQHGKPLEGEQLELFKKLGKSILYLDDSPKDAAPALRYDINLFIYERGHINNLFDKFPKLKF